MALSEDLRNEYARGIDFRPAERRELEDYFRRTAEAALLENPLVSEELMNKWLGVGSGANSRSLLCVAALGTHPLTPAQKEHVLRDPRLTVLVRFLQTQHCTSDQLATILNATRAENGSLTPGVCTLAFDHVDVIGAMPSDLLKEAALCADYFSVIRWLSTTGVGEYSDVARDVIPLVPQEKGRITLYQRLILDAFVEHRPDLHADMVNVSLYLSPLAGSRRFSDVALQRQLVNLDDAKKPTKASFSRFQNRSFALMALVANPVCDIALVEEILSFASQCAGNDSIDKLIGAAKTRLLSGRPQVQEAYEEITDPLLLGWLTTRCMPKFSDGKTSRPYDVAALLQNTHLSSLQRSQLEACSYDASLGLEIPLCAAHEAYEHADATHADDEWSEEKYHAFVAKLDGPNQSLVWSWESEKYFFEHLGTSVGAWSSFFSLSDNWTMGFKDLVATAAELA